MYHAFFSVFWLLYIIAVAMSVFLGAFMFHVLFVAITCGLPTVRGVKSVLL
jgi:hypothetical protein